MARADITITRFTGDDGLYYFNIKAKNGEVIAPSEGYKQQRTRDRRAWWWRDVLGGYKAPGVVRMTDK